MWAPDYKQVVIAVLALVLGVQTVRLGAEKAAHQQSKTDHAEALRTIAEKTAQAHQSVAAFTASVSRDLAEKDRQHTQELHHAKTDNDRLRLAARAGAASVRLKGHDCAASAGAVPTATFSGGLGHGAASADGEFREAVFDHRAAVIAAEAQIRYLQDYARICQQTPEAAR